ncbi:FecR family protein [Enhydrobacter sp.]|jgi:transmembrane sensor|uniref:FecR family protein n=1 Tax=Enhydrobacter sp. TaxID=1894999 RepID=UPI00261CAB0D|nr:FecR family protein [Enhydrobacter sp.]WIM11020.1 MAG: Iron siderophore sensor protein [Enhydrobacter sp.]
MSDRARDLLIEEALRWLVVLRDKSADERDRRAFDRWRTADPAHEAAWQRAQAVWQRADILGPHLRSRRPVPRPWTRRRWLQAAAVGAVAIPAGVLFLRSDLLSDLLADFRTTAGERRTFALADGSTVELAGASALAVSFSANARHLRLIEGEAFFDVFPDPGRPFVVEAGAGRTHALGTAFDVKLGDGSVDVAVSAHKVAVSIADGPPTIVEQGRTVRYTTDRIELARPADLRAVEAWRRDRLVFQEAPLGEVIADLQRCRGGRILLTDARLRDLRVTAVFDTRQVDAALATIASTLPIRLHRFTDWLVVLSPSG